MKHIDLLHAIAFILGIITMGYMTTEAPFGIMLTAVGYAGFTYLAGLRKGFKDGINRGLHLAHSAIRDVLHGSKRKQHHGEEERK